MTRRHGLAPAVLLALSLLGYGCLLKPGHSPFSPFSDFVSHILGTQTVLYESVHGGHGLPFWRADELSGTAALADPANAYLSPLNVLFWILPPLQAAGPTLWLYFLAAGLAGYAAGAALELSPEARLFMGTAQLFNLKLILLAYAGWIYAVPATVLLPLLFASVYRAVERPGPYSALEVGASGALCLCSGQPQLFYYSALFLAAMVAARGKKSAWGPLAAGGALAAGLSACVLIPLALDAPMVSRGRPTYEFFLSGHALTLKHLLTFLHPEILGTPLNGSYPGAELWEDAAYFGLVPLLLAAAGAFMLRRRPLARLISAAFAVSLALALRSPLQKLLFDLLPGFRLFRLPSRFLFLAGWFGVALAGLGVDEAQRRWKKKVPIFLLIGAVALEGAYYARRYLIMAPHEQTLPKAGYADFLARQDGVFRTAPVERGALNYGWAAPLGLSLAPGNDSYNYSRYQSYCDLLRWGKVRPEGARVWTDIPVIDRPDLLDALNVRYLVSRTPKDLPRGRFALAATLHEQPFFELYKGSSRGDMYVYENKAARPRAFFAEKTLPAAGPEEAARLIQETDLRTTAVVEAPVPENASAAPGDRVEIGAARGGSLDMRTRASGPRYLVMSEVWHPGWRATLDGAELALHKTDMALMGAWVPPGEHLIALRYRTPGWDLGLVVTLLSALLCLALLLRGRRGSSVPPARFSE